MFVMSYLACHLALTFVSQLVFARDFKLGLLIPKEQNLTTYAWYTSASAISLAIDRIQSENLLPGHTLSVLWKDTRGLPVQAAGKAVELRNAGVDVIIGPPKSVCTMPVGYLTAFWDKPHISWKSSDTAMDNKLAFATLIRTIGPFHAIGNMFSEIFSHFGWRRAGLLTLTEGKCKSDSVGIREHLTENNVTVVEDLKFDSHGATDTGIELHLEQLRRAARIIILCAEKEQLQKILMKAYDKGMTNSEYAYFISKSQAPDRQDISVPWLVNGHPDSRLAEAYKYVFDVTLPASFGGKLDAFRAEIPRRMTQPPWNSTYALDNNLIGSQYSAYLYDAVYTYASVVSHALRYNLDYSSGRQLASLVSNVTFTSVTGEVSFDEQADRQPAYWVWSYLDGRSLPQTIAKFHVHNEKGKRVVFSREPTWHTKDGLPPPDVPVCGFTGQLCPVDYTARNNALIGGVVAAVVLIVMFTVTMHLFRKRQFESQLAMMLWKVKYEDIELTSRKTAIGSQMSIKSSKSGGIAPDILTLTGLLIGRYKGNLVVVSPLSLDTVQLSRSEQIELKTMRDMNHKNVNLFVGACFDPPNICIVYMFCAKGSLPDILENDDINLDWMFKFSLINDAVNGMVYLHSTPLVSHGRLKSSSCVVDSRWMLKITDYGLNELIASHRLKVPAEGDVHKGLLWCAPELLREKPIPPKGTQSGDVYSFGIILHEICFRSGPFPSDTLSPEEIVGKVRAGEPVPFRPSTDLGQQVEKSLIGLMENCWAEASEKRPDFAGIRHALKQNKKFNNKDNIMDTMLKMMEKYANNLEDLVEQRTQELVDEKIKTDALLYRLLPLPVAEKLKSGETVDPELFDCVTIFFSDIVGFTSISALSTPMEVVTLLNDLYTLFDDVIAQYDIYKVETIGDAYMVVSGLPKRIKAHACEIADMSLHVISGLMQFTVRHMPDRKLKVRIGLHSGPCCAAMRVHASQQCADLLSQDGSYHISARGLINIKDKGQYMTYWVNGKDDYDKILPDPSTFEVDSAVIPDIISQSNTPEVQTQ